MALWSIPLWWIYYLKSLTVYHIHSPFLFDFATRLWSPHFRPHVCVTGSRKNQNLTTKKWITVLSSYYRVRHFLLDERLPELFGVAHELGLSSPQKSAGEANLHPFMAYVKPVLQPRSKSKYSFEVLIIGDSLSMNLLISSRGGMNYESGVFLCLDIHKSRNRYTAWENIRGQKEFNFSIELYNFGLLFKHPVNQRPEHITLISWWFKPWKIKLL